MTKVFDRDGISFRYPANWLLDLEEVDTGWTVSVQSPGTAFLVLSFDGSGPDPEEVAETTLAALRSDYNDLDSQDQVETLAGCLAIGHDIQFLSLDLPNSCSTRTFQTDNGTVLVMTQLADHELETSGAVLQAICESLQVKD